MVERLGADLVVLAAGKSSRLGMPKGLVRVGGRPWLELQVRAAAEAGVRRTVVVVSPANLDAYAEATASVQADVVVNEAPDRGPFSSLQCGLAALAALSGESAAAPAFVLPLDVPAPSVEVWRALVAGLETKAGAGGAAVRAAVPDFQGPGFQRGGGHPVLLGPSFSAYLLSLPAEECRLDYALKAEDARLEAIAAKRGNGGVGVVKVAVFDERVRMNLNTPSDWRKIVR